MTTMIYAADFTQHPVRSKSEQMEERLDKLYKFIVEHKVNNDGNSPTLREMCEAMGMNSTSLLSYYLDALEKRGKIERGQNDTRSIRVVGGKWHPPSRMA